MDCWIGVDMSESGGVAVLPDSKGRIGLRWEFRNTPEGRRAWLGEISKLGKVGLVLETTESFSERIVAEALSLELAVFVASAQVLQHFRLSEGYEDKTDDLDALLLGLMGQRGVRGVQPALLVPPASLELRALVRMRHRLTNLQVELGQKLRARLLQISPEISGPDWIGPKVTSATFLAVLRRWPDLLSLQRAQLRTVSQLVRKTGRYPRAQAQDIAHCLKEWSRDLGRLSDSSREMASLELQLLRENLELQHRQIRVLDQRIRAAVDSHPRGPALLEMPGIGWIVAAWLLAEALPRAVSSSEEQMATYSGLTPASRSSGKSQRSRLRRFVNRHLSGIYFTSAVASLKHESLDRDYYEKKRGHFQGHPAAHVKAVIALARQRHKVIYKILRGEARYDAVQLARSTLARARRAA